MSQPTVSSNDILVRAQDTPNPSALKFVVNISLIHSGKVTFTSATECKDIPMVYSIMGIPGIVQVYLFQNSMTVTHDGSLVNESLKEQITSIITTRAPIHNPEIQSTQTEPVKNSKKDLTNLPPERQHIEEILDRTIRPGLQADGGDVEVISLKDNVLRILYEGACGGCPSATMGTLDAIQNILRHEMDNPDLYVVPL